jgi:hypothetical protein
MYIDVFREDINKYLADLSLNLEITGIQRQHINIKEVFISQMN